MAGTSLAKGSPSHSQGGLPEAEFELTELQETSGRRFRQFYEIYQTSMPVREQKKSRTIKDLIGRQDYRVDLLQAGSDVISFSIVFTPPGQSMVLLEYMATDPTRRNSGLGARIFHASFDKTPRRSMLVEVDSERENSADRALRIRRKNFYRRQGCLKIAKLDYLLALPGVGAPPVMDLMIKPRAGLDELPRRNIRRWLKSIFVDVYDQSADDPRIETMMRDLSDPVGLD